MLPPHNPAQTPVQPKPNVVWTIMPPPLVAFQMWVDGSIKITFAPEHADAVLANLENHLNAFRSAKALVDNPPKKCVRCRGNGQVNETKEGGEKVPVVCPDCKGSGRLNFIPPNVQPNAAPVAPSVIPPVFAKTVDPKLTVTVDPSKITPAQAAMMTAPPSFVDNEAPPPPEAITLVDDSPPVVALPHETLQPIDLDGDLLPQMQKLLAKHGYKVVPLTKEENAESLARLTDDNHPTEPPSAPITEDENTAPAISLAELVSATEK